MAGRPGGTALAALLALGALVLLCVTSSSSAHTSGRLRPQLLVSAAAMGCHGTSSRRQGGRDPCTAQQGNAEPRPAREKELVLVTGGAGFIGSALVELLLELGYRVRVLDDLSTGHPGNLNGSHPGLQFLYGDVTRDQDCAQAVAGVAGVFHLAAAGMRAAELGPKPSIRSGPMAEPGPSSSGQLDRTPGPQLDAGRHSLRVNVDGTHAVLRAALAAGGVRKVVYAGSSTAYGRAHPAPLDEELPPDPQGPYATSKAMAEALLRQFDSTHGLPTLTLRLFSVYGRRQQQEGVYAVPMERFVEAAEQGKAPPMEDAAGRPADYIHVRDVARALLLAFQSEARDVAINVGSGALADTCLAKAVLGFQAKKGFSGGMAAEVERIQRGEAVERYSQPVVSAEIVLARGNGEDISWLEDSRMPLMRRFIYDNSDFDAEDSIPIKMGGEVIPYVYHIIKNYDRLPAVVIFTQAAPMDHVGSGDEKYGAQRFFCLAHMALERQPNYTGWGFEHTEANLGGTSLNKYADKFLQTLGVERREPNTLVFNGIHGTTRAAIHAHPREWWTLLWELLTNAYKYPESHALGQDWKHDRDVQGGDHLVERYWHVFLDPANAWERGREEEHKRCPPHW